jgi:DNA gyrase subunit A
VSIAVATPPPSEPREPLPLNIEEELKESYLTYAMSVIVSRALPDARDGLKPSQRRILAAMLDLGLTPGGSTSKCAGIVGETMKRYHPHGDNSIYPTLARMAQWWNMRHLLVTGQGNFGSIHGLPPAAMRYTEAKLSPVAAEMLDDIKLDTVDFQPSYDEKHQEPRVLPARFPNLLVNGSGGIAVGMATSIPPHNLGEVCDALIALIDNPAIDFEDLIEKLPGPDFPTGGVICGRMGIREAYLTGRGRIVLRAKHVVEETRDGRTQIVFTEIPYQLMKEPLLKKLGDLVNTDRIKGIADVVDESDRRQPVRIVVKLKRNEDPNVILNQLYQYSPLQDTFGVIMLALVDGRPKTLTLRELLKIYLDHRANVIRRRTAFLLRRDRARAHVVEGLLIALDMIDEIIHIIRSSPNPTEARTRLMGMAVGPDVMRRALNDPEAQATTGLTRNQADAILAMRLQQLTGLELDKLVAEYRELRAAIADAEDILAREVRVREIIKADLEELKRKYADPRRTVISDEELGSYDKEALIREEYMVVTITDGGYIKRLPPSTYRAQGRGGRGKTAAGTKEGDFLAHMFVALTHDYLLFFTDQGLIHWLKVYDVPIAPRTATGRAIVNLLELREGERITGVIPVRRFPDNEFLFMATRRGTVKKTPLSAYSRPQRGGIIALGLEEGDQLIAVARTQPGDHVILSTRNGMAIRFEESDVRPMGRPACGVRGIRLEGDDQVVGMVVANGPDDPASLLTVCSNGFGKRTRLSEYRAQHRGGKGLIDIKTTERNGPVVAIAKVTDADEVMLTTERGILIRTGLNETRDIGRNTQGVRLIRVDEGDRVVALAKLPESELSQDQPDVAEVEPPPDPNAPPLAASDRLFANGILALDDLSGADSASHEKEEEIPFDTGGDGLEPAEDDGVAADD